ncbi:MAG: DUF4173 domain-containing protein [Chloracidobacterium sp.]|nr:DUF4173 domain-containing protein [Chloracidobacterium sp.]
MTDRTKTGLQIIQAAIIVGVAGNILLRQTPWGLNAFLFVTLFVAGLLMLMRRSRPELLNLTNLSLAGAMLFFGTMFLVRDSIEMRVADTIAVIIAMGVLIPGSFGIRARIGGTFHYIAGLIAAALSSFFGGFVLLAADIDWKAMPGNGLSRSVFAVLRGLAIALPLVLIFGALFMAADAVFEGWVNRAIDFELDTIISHVMLTSVLAWLTAGYLRSAVGGSFTAEPETPATATGHRTDGPSYVQKVADEPVDTENTLPNNATVVEHINATDVPEDATSAATPAASADAPPAKKQKRDWQNIDSSKLPHVFTLGTVEIGIILGLLNGLFLIFVIAQVPYLFGGMELVQNTPDFKLADYARRGFGELVAVSALVLPILLVGHWLVRKDKPVTGTLFRVLAGIQIALLFVIMASAVQRLVLLTGNLGYGLTTIRLYPLIFMAWLAVVFVWFSATVLRGARQHFAWGALWSAFVILGATNLMNPDKFIVEHNLALMREGREFDAYFNTSLSDDALPSVFLALPDMNDEDARWAAYSLARRHCEKLEEADLRSWNLSRSAASGLLVRNSGFVDLLGGCEAPRLRPYRGLD